MNSELKAISNERLEELIQAKQGVPGYAFVGANEATITALRELVELRAALSSSEGLVRDEQAAHERIGKLLLPLVGTGDGTSVSCAKKAAEEIVSLRGLVRELAEALRIHVDNEHGLCQLDDESDIKLLYRPEVRRILEGK